jgi:hypothetical protein
MKMNVAHVLELCDNQGQQYFDLIKKLMLD